MSGDDRRVIKTTAEIEAMARAGHVAACTLRSALDAAIPGATTAQLDAAAREAIRAAGAQAIFPGYVQGNSPPFPAATCISVNEEVVHGIPGPRPLAPGDLVTVDVGVRLAGWCADSARSIVVPCLPNQEPTAAQAVRAREAQSLIDATCRLLELAIDLIRPGIAWSRIAAALERAAWDRGFGIVTEYIGHGIGRDLHEAPRAPAYWTGFKGEDFVLEEGMTLAVEPMLTSRREPSGGALGRGVDADGLPAWRTRIRGAGDGWTIATRDGSLACHEEHVVAVVSGGSRVLTLENPRQDEGFLAATGLGAERGL